MNDKSTVARAQFLSWLRAQYPELYASISDADASGVGGFFDSVGTAFSSALNNVTKALPSLASSYSDYKSAEALIKTNAQRAAQGLSPLVMDANGRLTTSNGYPYTANDFSLASTGMGATSWIVIGGAALLVVYLIASRR